MHHLLEDTTPSSVHEVVKNAIVKSIEIDTETQSSWKVKYGKRGNYLPYDDIVWRYQKTLLSMCMEHVREALVIIFCFRFRIQGYC